MNVERLTVMTQSSWDLDGWVAVFDFKVRYFFGCQQASVTCQYTLAGQHTARSFDVQVLAELPSILDSQVPLYTLSWWGMSASCSGSRWIVAATTTASVAAVVYAVYCRQVESSPKTWQALRRNVGKIFASMHSLSLTFLQATPNVESMAAATWSPRFT